MSLKKSEEAVGDYLNKRPYLASVATFSQQHTSISLHSSSTVVRSPEIVVRGRWTTTVPGFLGEELLLNHRRSGRDLGMQLGVSRYYAHDAVLSSAHSELRERVDGAIALPAHKRIRTSLTTSVVERRSKRSFSSVSTSMEELATILWHGQGISGLLPVGTVQEPDATVSLRNAPSGGGLYPIRLAVMARNVEGLARGIYEYQPHSHTLFPLNSSPESADLSNCMWTTDIALDGVGFGLAFIYDLYTNSQKYGDSGLVFALIEVGGISQNIQLARSALGLIGCDQGGYNKQLLETLIGCDGTSQHVTHFTLIGHGEG